MELSQSLRPFLQFCEMLEKLKNKWGVGSLQLLLILTTFALGGSACGIISKKILSVLDLNNGLFNTILYILLITIFWPVCVLLISIPFGQFSFFRNYISRVIRKLTGKKSPSDKL